jgi:hypothetical protein
VLAISVEREVSLAIEDDVVVNDNFGLGHHGLRSVAAKRVRTAAFRNGIANALLSAWELLSRHATASAVASDAAVTTTTTRARRLAAAHERHQPERADA